MERLAFSNFFLLSLPFIPSIHCATKLNIKQIDIMRNLSQTLNQISSENTHWMNNDLDPCHWYGVACSSTSSPVITKLSFSYFGISSPDSSFLNLFFNLLCDLDTLQYLDLSNNYMPDVPDLFFSNCSGLQELIYLNLKKIEMAGLLPNFCCFRNLEILDLSYNLLEGRNVSAHFYNLSKLKGLNLSSNILSGNTPVIASRELVLSSNQFSGTFPMEIFEQTNLFILDLSRNNLEGFIPNKFGQLPLLSFLRLNENKFTGNIPDSISNITYLSRFSANLNNFYGFIPIGLTDHLKNLDLSYNHLSGELPYNLLSFPYLEMIDLSGNLLEGPIPVNMSSNIQRLRLSNNSFNGGIPASIGNITKLVDLGLDGNRLEGSIPSEIGKCKNLSALNLGSNFCMEACQCN
jgi:Leucine rich repeat/Leucine rich repeat N-terminal domain